MTTDASTISGRRRRSRPLTVEEVLALPASVDVETTARCLNIGRDKAHRLIRDQEFPITVLTLGAKHRCRLVDICEWLGLSLLFATTTEERASPDRRKQADRRSATVDRRSTVDGG